MQKIIRSVLASLVATAFIAAPAFAQQKLKIGFISTFSGPQGAIGEDMKNSVELALDHLNRKVGGLDT
jgi:branched-chain amino acid transport system substrate-binding protein